MRNLLLIGAAALLAVVSGCATGGQSVIGPAIVQEGVTVGVQGAVIKYPTAVPYLKAADVVICEQANGTNLSPSEVVAALGTNANLAVLKTPEGALILNGALLLYDAALNGLGSNSQINSSNVQPYLQAVCVGIQDGLPPSTAARRSGVRGERLGLMGQWPLVPIP